MVGRCRGSHILWTISLKMVVRLSALHIARPLLQEDFWYSFLLKRLSKPHGHSVAGRIRSIEISSNLIGNRTCSLRACSIVPRD
jgi:hypothetical protein